MKSLFRVFAMAALVLALGAGRAAAIEYGDIFELTMKGVSDQTIVQLIVDDGRAFELSEQELADLRAAGVSERVIDAMLDPAVGAAWLRGDSAPTVDDYSTPLDKAYQQGYQDGEQSTALVYSFGYYYGPLSRYYYNDPFYYPFWYDGYACAYWPSYYAYWWRPAYSWCYAYPYNWYTWNSYYCYTYYDPGYWAYNGYGVMPGYHHTIYDGSPRWREGGVEPPKGGRTAVADPSMGRAVDGYTASMRGGKPAPPAILESTANRDSRATSLDRGNLRGGTSGRIADTNARVIRSRPDSPGQLKGVDERTSWTSSGTRRSETLRGQAQRNSYSRGAERTTPQAAGGRAARSSDVRRGNRDVTGGNVRGAQPPSRSGGREASSGSRGSTGGRSEAPAMRGGGSAPRGGGNGGMRAPSSGRSAPAPSAPRGGGGGSGRAVSSGNAGGRGR